MTIFIFRSNAVGTNSVRFEFLNRLEPRNRKSFTLLSCQLVIACISADLGWGNECVCLPFTIAAPRALQAQEGQMHRNNTDRLEQCLKERQPMPSQRSSSRPCKTCVLQASGSRRTLQGPSSLVTSHRTISHSRSCLCIPLGQLSSRSSESVYTATLSLAGKSEHSNSFQVRRSPLPPSYLKGEKKDQKIHRNRVNKRA